MLWQRWRCFLFSSREISYIAFSHKILCRIHTKFCDRNHTKFCVDLHKILCGPTQNFVCTKQTSLQHDHSSKQQTTPSSIIVIEFIVIRHTILPTRYRHRRLKWAPTRTDADAAPIRQYTCYATTHRRRSLRALSHCRLPCRSSNNHIDVVSPSS